MQKRMKRKKRVKRVKAEDIEKVKVTFGPIRKGVKPISDERSV